MGLRRRRTVYWLLSYLPTSLFQINLIAELFQTHALKNPSSMVQMVQGIKRLQEVYPLRLFPMKYRVEIGTKIR